MIIFMQKRGGKFPRPRLEMQLSEQLHTQSIKFSSNELEATTQEGTVQSVKQPCWELFKQQPMYGPFGKSVLSNKQIIETIKNILFFLHVCII